VAGDCTNGIAKRTTNSNRSLGRKVAEIDRNLKHLSGLAHPHGATGYDEQSSTTVKEQQGKNRTGAAHRHRTLSRSDSW
jgi:hypothetical protein